MNGSPAINEPLAHIELLLRRDVDSEAACELRDRFEKLGFATDVRHVHHARDVGVIVWLVLAALPLRAFLDGVAGQAATDSYQGIKRLVECLVPGRERLLADESAATVPVQAPAVAPLVLQDWGSGLQVVLEADLPPEAYRQLVGLDLSDFRTGPVRYDKDLACWRPVPDEP
ncbi:hypothetical protein [Streptomyces sp. NPDC001401]|uniref:hypothetical protein n=1 Tax=Streptomyces sp. NPDC001401 TaxID=3364570 RepID=UPI0036D14247